MKKTLSVLTIFLFLLSSLIPIASSNPSYETNKVYTIHIDENGTLSGYVTDPAMNPIEGAIIRASCGENYFENVSDSSGYYYIDNIPIVFCLWNVSASKTGYKTIWAEMSIGENTKYDFVLTPLGKTLYVGGGGPNNYSSIQDAVDNASDGDIVYVYRGTYYENVVINKIINLIGEDKDTTVINGEYDGNTVYVSCERVTIKGFTVNGGGLKGGTFDFFIAGIKIKSSNCVIKENIIKDNRQGVLGVRVSNLTISDNIFINDAITISCYESLARPWFSKREHFNHTILNNTVNGRKILYYKNQDNVIVPSDCGQLIAFNCKYISIKDLDISNTITPILLAYCHYCQISNCTISKSDGIWTFMSNYNTFENNNISNNTMNGITLDYKSNNNIIRNNHIANNKMVGIMLEWYSKNNEIIENNLINNYYNGYQIQCFRNRWYKNYWDDWKGLKNPFFRFIPKFISVSCIELLPRTALPLNFDWHPAQEPYDIPEVV